MLQEKRFKEFLSTKRKVVALCNEMDYDPETSFERDLICEDDEAFQLSVQNMESLKTVLHDVRNLFHFATSYPLTFLHCLIFTFCLFCCCVFFGFFFPRKMSRMELEKNK